MNQGQAQGQPGEPVGLPEYRNRPANRAARRGQQNVHQLEPVNEPHGNPPEGALAARIGPAIWLAIRLIGVVWLFTSGNTTWTRWFLFSAIAFLIFLVNTGVLNGFGDQLWGPIRRHVERLIPLAGPEAALVPAANAAIPQAGAAPVPAPGNEPAPRATNGEPDPAQVAARLLEERRQQNGGWLLAQVRRAEHALLLFLASLVPGVGERHIAHREAEANAAEAERQRRIAEAAAAAAAAENPESTGEGNGEGAGAEDQTASAGESQPAQAEQPPNEQGAAAPPLIEV